MRRLVVLVVASACGRLDFETRAVLDPDASVAPPVQRGAAACEIAMERWHLQPPTRLTEIETLLSAAYPANGNRSEFDPVFSEDGLTLYFSSDIAMRFEVWQAHRATLDAPFTSVERMDASVNAAPNLHFGFQPLAHLGIATISAPYAGAVGDLDYWRGTRDGTTWRWSPTALSTVGSDGDARLTADGLSLFFPRGDQGAADLYRVRRASVDVDFDPAREEAIAEINSPAADTAPAPFAGGILFASKRTAPAGADDLWAAALPLGAETYAAPVALTELNAAGFDGEPTLFGGAGYCELVFISDRGGTFDLYRSRILP